MYEEIRGLGNNLMDNLLMRLDGELNAYLRRLYTSLANTLHMKRNTDVLTIDNHKNYGKMLCIDV